MLISVLNYPVVAKRTRDKANFILYFSQKIDFKNVIPVLLCQHRDKNKMSMGVYAGIDREIS